MDQSILDWLLEEETPEVRLRTLKEYMKLPDNDEKVIECKKRLLESKTYERVLKKLRKDKPWDKFDAIMALAEEHHLLVVEDAAHSIDSFYKGRPLGGIGHLGAFSFHETKNINCGEGGMLVVNDERFVRRSEIIWEKGTNRAEFYRGMVNKYGWCDIGSSFLPSEFNAAFLWAQLEQLDDIQGKRLRIWKIYDGILRGKVEEKGVQLPEIPSYATNNGHMYYLVCPTLEFRTRLMAFLKEHDIQTTFHYLPLHSSAYYKDQFRGEPLVHCDHYGDCLVRLPLYYELSDEDATRVAQLVLEGVNG